MKREEREGEEDKEGRERERVEDEEGREREGGG